MDPLAEKQFNWSSFAYCHNNPINLIDPNGCDTINPIIQTKAYKRFEDTKEGKSFIDQFVNGEYKDDLLKFYDSKSMYDLGNANISYSIPGSSVLIDIKDAMEADMDKNLSLVYTINIKSSYLKDKSIDATLTLGHEAFLHLSGRIKSVNQIMRSDLSASDKAKSLRAIGNSPFSYSNGQFINDGGAVDHAKFVNGTATQFNNYILQVAQQFKPHSVGASLWNFVVNNHYQKYKNDAWVKYNLQSNK